jgi:hypothetical protein
MHPKGDYLSVDSEAETHLIRQRCIELLHLSQNREPIVEDKAH